MSETKEQIKARYPLPVYNYRVTIQSGAESAVISFAQVSGLNLDYQPVTYKHGLSFLMGDQIIPGMRQAINITLKKGLTRQGQYLYEWINHAYHKPFYEKAKRDIVIDLCGEKSEPLVRWKVIKALPTKLSMPEFDANSNDVAVESMELVAHNLKVEHFS